jgi:hypothetical protein
MDMLPRYSEELGAANEMTTSPAKTTMSPLVLAPLRMNRDHRGATE